MAFSTFSNTFNDDKSHVESNLIGCYSVSRYQASFTTEYLNISLFVFMQYFVDILQTKVLNS